MQARCKSGIGEERLTAFNGCFQKLFSNSWWQVHSGKCCRVAIVAGTASWLYFTLLPGGGLCLLMSAQSSNNVYVDGKLSAKTLLRSLYSCLSHG